MTRGRVVVDTNVFVSGLFTRIVSGAGREADHYEWPAAGVDGHVAQSIRTLLSPKFDRYVSRPRREALLDRLGPHLEIVEVVQRVRAYRDPRDDIFLEVALNGEASVIVTGDDDLQALHPFRGIDILRPTTYLDQAPPTAE